MKNINALICVLLLYLFACSSQKNQASDSGNNTAKMPIKTDEILFINLKIDAKNANEKSISMINTIKSIGKLKTAPPQFSPNQNSTFLTCSFLNSQKKKVDAINIEHPLLRDVESYEENGSIQKNALNLSTAEFSIRIQNNYDARYIVIEEVIKGKKSQKSFTLNLDSE